MEAMMPKRFWYGIAVIAGLMLVASPFRASAQQRFYEGKTIRIIVGFSPGGGFDAYSRLISRHMGRHIPGNPTIIVENMPGAGSLIAGNHIYKVAKPDGLTIGNFHGNQIIGQLLGREGIEFDARKFEWIGVPVKDNTVCALTKASGITSIEQWLAAKAPVKLGGIAPGDTTHDMVRVLQAALNLPIQLVRGYKGTADIRLAAEAGEVAGGCWQWESMKATWRKAIEAGDVTVVLQAGPQPHPELPKVPVVGSVTKSDEARRLIRAGIQDPAVITRPYSLPPGTPKDRVETLRKAFLETLRDPALLAEAEKSKLDVNPVSGEELERIIAELFKLDPALVAKLRETLK
jgi:tripartite-type tricarboxylate transporter receptor subunit TctC